jgi:DNA-binding transcriptional regulator YdaS (Cro superfamily)
MSFPPFHAQPETAERVRAAIVGSVGPEVGWSVRAAERLGVQRTTVSGWVCGRQLPSLTQFVAIAGMTGTTLDWLVRGKQ